MLRELVLPVPAMIMHHGDEPDSSLKHILTDIGYPDDLIFQSEQDDTAFKIMDRHLPNLLLVDLDTPPEVIQQLHQINQGMLIIGISGHDPVKILRAIHAGISGYLFTDQSPEQQKNQVIMTLRGGSPIDTEVAQLMLKCIGKTDLPFRFTDTEQEILNLAGHGIELEQISDDLHIPEYMIPGYIKNIYRKISMYQSDEQYCLCH